MLLENGELHPFEKQPAGATDKYKMYDKHIVSWFIISGLHLFDKDVYLNFIIAYSLLISHFVLFIFT